MCIVSTNQEQDNRHAEQKLLRWGVLRAVINLFPHIQVVVGTGVKVERHATHIVEHEIGAEHVGDVRECPGQLLRDSGDDIVEDFEAHDDNEVDGPGPCIDEHKSAMPVPHKGA